MTFSNDQVTFVNSDFTTASTLLVAAITKVAGPNITPVQHMSKIFNDYTAQVKETYLRITIHDWYEDLATATQNASGANQASVKAKINEARAILGLTPIP